MVSLIELFSLPSLSVDVQISNTAGSTCIKLSIRLHCWTGERIRDRLVAANSIAKAGAGWMQIVQMDTGLLIVAC